MHGQPHIKYFVYLFMCDLMSYYTERNENLAQTLHGEVPCYSVSKMLYSISHKTCTSPVIGARCRRIDLRTLLVKVYVKSGIRRFKGTGHCAANQCFENA